MTKQLVPVGAAFDAAGNLYLATYYSGASIPEYAPDGTLVRSLQTGSSAGVRDVQVSPDQKTLYYSTGSTIKRLDLVSGKILSDFATVTGLAIEFQLLPDGGMLVANETGVTPDNQHFWTGGYDGGSAVEFDLVTGAQVASFQTPPFVTSISVYNPAAFGSDPAGPATGTPEPASLGLVALSLCGLALCRRPNA